MATPTTSNPPSVVLDASFLIAYCAKEPARFAKAQSELARYTTEGWELFVPGVVVAECLYALCRKLMESELTLIEHTQAVHSFHTLMKTVQASPSGESSLILRAEAIRTTYGCSRSADSIYLARAEQLAGLGKAEIVTFDEGIDNHAKKNAPTVKVNALVA
jgi:predicted nucleic acid-binding protein